MKVTNLQFLNALLYVAEHGCKWRGLPKRFGSWHTIYTRMNRWSKAGVLDVVFEQLQREQLVRIRIEAVSLDSTTVKVHPDGMGAPPSLAEFCNAARLIISHCEECHRFVFARPVKDFLKLEEDAHLFTSYISNAGSGFRLHWLLPSDEVQYPVFESWPGEAEGSTPVDTVFKHL